MKFTLFQRALLWSGAAHLVLVILTPILGSTDSMTQPIAVQVTFTAPIALAPAEESEPEVREEPEPALRPEPSSSTSEATPSASPETSKLSPPEPPPAPPEPDLSFVEPASIMGAPVHDLDRPETEAAAPERESAAELQARIDALLEASLESVRRQNAQRVRMDYAFMVREALRVVLERNHPGVGLADDSLATTGILISFRVTREGYLYDLSIRRAPGGRLPAASLPSEIRALSPFPAPPIEVETPASFHYHVRFQ